MQVDGLLLVPWQSARTGAPERSASMAAQQKNLPNPWSHEWKIISPWAPSYELQFLPVWRREKKRCAAGIWSFAKVVTWGDPTCSDGRKKKRPRETVTSSERRSCRAVPGRRGLGHSRFMRMHTRTEMHSTPTRRVVAQKAAAMTRSKQRTRAHL